MPLQPDSKPDWGNQYRLHAAVRRYWDGERVAFGVSVVMASGKK
jgi:hypothetical protein